MNTKIIVARLRAFVVLIVLIVLMQDDAALAQSGLALVRGLVVESSSTPAAGASVTVTNVDSGAQRELTTDANGRFAAVGLPPGVYDIEARRQGLATRRQEGLRLTAGASVDLRFELREAPSADTITVNDVPVTIEPGTAAVRDVIAGETLAALPLRGRNVLDLAATLPTVSRRRDGDLLVAGHDPLLLRLAIDGFDGSSPLGAGATGAGGADSPWPLPLEAVDGLRFDAATYDVESGGAGTAVLSVATKSGGNTLRGSALAFAPGNEFGGSIGGPIARDRHFFFASFEGRRDTASDETVDDRLTQNGLFARTDHRLGDTHQLGARFVYSDFSRVAPAWSSNVDAHAAGGHLHSAFSHAVVHEVRLHLGRREGALTLSPVAGRGGVDHLQFANSLTWASGGHVMKAGIDASRDDAERSALAAIDVARFALFVQDDWRLGDVTVHGGIRNDQERFDPVGTHTDTWSPRGSIAWNPGAGRLVLRGGYGVFHARTPVFTGLTESPRVRQFSAGGEWEPLRHTVLSATYLRLSGDDVLAAAAGGDIAPLIARPFAVRAVDESTYDALALQAHRRFAQGYSYRLSYTVARANDSGADGTFDQRHRVAASFVYPTDVVASRYSGWVRRALADWTLSGVAIVTRSPWERGTLDIRAARHFELTGTARLALLLDIVALNRGDQPGIITAVPEGRMLRVGARVVF